MVRFWVAVLALAGCGRIEFSSRTERPDAAPPPPDPDAWVCGGAYRSLVLADAPLAYWRFDESSGSTFADATGHGFDGAIVGAPTMAAPCTTASRPRDSYVTLAGADGATIARPFAAALDNAALEVWVRLPSTENWPAVFGRDNWDYDWGIGMTPTNWNGAGGTYPVFGHYYLQGTTSCSTCSAQSSVGIADNAWHHVVGTLAMNAPGDYTYTIYVDGAVTGTSNGTEGTIASSSGTLVIGTGDVQGFPFDGDAADLAFYDHNLTAAQVLAHYQAH